MPDHLLLTIHLVATAYMTGLIWFVGLVHYPLMARVGPREWPAYERAHTVRTTPVVFPAMITELATAVLIALEPPRAVPGWAGWLGAFLVVLVWASTFLVQVPLHGALTRTDDPARTALLIRRLVLTNHARTLLWSARCALAAWMLVTYHPAP